MAHFWHEISKYWQAIVLAIVSAVGVLISWLQWGTAKKQRQTAERQARTARNKLRLDLFERRFSVFEALMRLAQIAVAKADVPDEERQRCAIATKGALFLFDADIQNYCDNLIKEALTLQAAKMIIDTKQGAGSEQYERTLKVHSEGVKWFSEQIDEIPKRFAKFLKLEG